jgi:hypothetical protein
MDEAKWGDEEEIDIEDDIMAEDDSEVAPATE